MVGCIADPYSRIGVGSGIRLELMSLGILISLTVFSQASVCENSLKGHRQPEEYEDGTIPFIGKGKQVTLPVCRIKDTYNCLGFIGDTTKLKDELDLIFKMIKNDSVSLRNGNSLPQPRSTSKAEELKEKLELLREFVKFFCVNGNCQLDSNDPSLGKCVPSPSGYPNTDVFNYGEWKKKVKHLMKNGNNQQQRQRNAQLNLLAQLVNQPYASLFWLSFD